MTNPPFSGSIEFKLAFRAFDESVIRKARVTYAYTPPWPYYHVRSCQERNDQLRLDLGLTLLALPRSDRSRTGRPPTNEPYWVPLGQLLTVGVLRTKVYDQLCMRIDTESLNTDRDNRRSAGLPLPPLPEHI